MKGATSTQARVENALRLLDRVRATGRKTTELEKLHSEINFIFDRVRSLENKGGSGFWKTKVGQESGKQRWVRGLENKGGPGVWKTKVGQGSGKQRWVRSLENKGGYTPRYSSLSPPSSSIVIQLYGVSMNRVFSLLFY